MPTAKQIKHLTSETADATQIKTKPERY